MGIAYNGIDKTNIYLNAVKKNFVYKDMSKVYQSFVSYYFQYANTIAPAFSNLGFPTGGYASYDGAGFKIGWNSNAGWTQRFAEGVFTVGVDLTNVKTIRLATGNLHDSISYSALGGSINIFNSLPTSHDWTPTRQRNLIHPVALGHVYDETIDIDVSDLTGVYYIGMTYTGPQGTVSGAWGYAIIYSTYLIANT